MANQLFDPKTNEEHTQSIANLLPSDPVFLSKNLNDSNFRQYLRIFAPEMSRFEDVMLEISREHDINEASVYLKDWETAVGIPDDCFFGNGTLEERRLHVIIKLACMNVDSDQDIIDLAAKLGKTITIRPISDNVLPPYTIPMIPTALPEARFVWLITGDNVQPAYPPYAIPHSLEVGDVILTCVIEKIKPAYVRVVFSND
jgi:uncharacterized protein YmfQ (DUF2313 family)